MDKLSWPGSFSQTNIPIVTYSYPLIFAFAFTTLIFALLGIVTITLLFLVCTFFICFFFRDPERIVTDKKDAVVSPADGRIILIKEESKSPFLEGTHIKISIFMSVFNVHVNRIPYTGKVTETIYHPGRFLPANFDKASLQNEHNAVILETKNGKQLCMVQIAGLIARRIISKIQIGEVVSRGQRFGMICFGSRVDIYLPCDTKLAVKLGSKVTAGSSVLGYLI